MRTSRLDGDRGRIRWVCAGSPRLHGADVAAALLGVSLDAILANELPPERSKALLAQLIEEVRVVSSAAVRVTYRIPSEVR
jgi:hypothetical protein